METSFVITHEGQQYEGKLELTYDSDGMVEDIECLEAFNQQGKELTEAEVDEIWWSIEEFVEKGNFDEEAPKDAYLPDRIEEARGEI